MDKFHTRIFIERLVAREVEGGGCPWQTQL